MEQEFVVKHTFVEFPEPAHRIRRRFSSDSMVLSVDQIKFDSRKCAEVLQDVSEASTGECENDHISNSSKEESCDKDLACQYNESWWMPMNQGMCYAFYDSNTFLPMQWMQQNAVAPESLCNDANAEQEWKTTVMIRNMPNNYTRDMLLALVDSMGFAQTYDFVYLPIDFKSQVGLGYAFINFVSVDQALLCIEMLEGYSNWTVPSEKICSVTWSSPTQGLDEHIERYRNSPVMHHSLPDEWKPALFQDGVRIEFPVPTKSIKTPKVRTPKASRS